MRLSDRALAPWLLGLAMIFAVVAIAHAEAPAEQPTEATAAAAEDARGLPVEVAGIKVFVDPETGRLRPPTAAEAQELAEAMKRVYAEKKAERHAPVAHKNGMMSLVLDPSYMRYTVAVKQADGSLALDCIDGHEKADERVEAVMDVESATVKTVAKVEEE